MAEVSATATPSIRKTLEPQREFLWWAVCINPPVQQTEQL